MRKDNKLKRINKILTLLVIVLVLMGVKKIEKKIQANVNDMFTIGTVSPGFSNAQSQDTKKGIQNTDYYFRNAKISSLLQSRTSPYQMLASRGTNARNTSNANWGHSNLNGENANSNNNNMFNGNASSVNENLSNGGNNSNAYGLRPTTLKILRYAILVYI